MKTAIKELFGLIISTQRELWTEAGMFLWDLFDDMPVMSHETQLIFRHEEDRAKYVDAVRRLRNEAEVTIKLHTGKEITLMR